MENLPWQFWFCKNDCELHFGYLDESDKTTSQVLEKNEQIAFINGAILQIHSFWSLILFLMQKYHFVFKLRNDGCFILFLFGMI